MKLYKCLFCDCIGMFDCILLGKFHSKVSCLYSKDLYGFFSFWNLQRQFWVINEDKWLLYFKQLVWIVKISCRMLNFRFEPLFLWKWVCYNKHCWFFNWDSQLCACVPWNGFLLLDKKNACFLYSIHRVCLF